MNTRINELQSLITVNHHALSGGYMVTLDGNKLGESVTYQGALTLAEQAIQQCKAG